MTTEEYIEKYHAHIQSLGIALKKEFLKDVRPEDLQVMRSILPLHIGIQAAMSEVAALGQCLIDAGVITLDNYRESILRQLSLQRDVVDMRTKDLKQS